ncbi:MAG: ABC transporter substrate-binding protein [Streptosporangiaceae bacterium]
MSARRATAILLSFLLLAALTACTGGFGGGNGKGESSVVVVGTTDKVISLDPANAYQLGSWPIVFNVYQFLLRVRPRGSQLVPDAARSCRFTKPTVYKCSLKKGLRFSNGDPLTASDVVYSFHRIGEIQAPAGPQTLLAPMKSVRASGERMVVFTLKHPDAVWPKVLATVAGAIVDEDVFPERKLLPSDKVIGSGPYTLARYQQNEQALLKPNPKYDGDAQLHNRGAIFRYFSKPSALKLALEQGDVHVAYRELSPVDIASLRHERDRGVKVVEGPGTQIQYLSFNLKTMPGGSPGQKLAIRKAVAMSLDRGTIAKNVYNRTVKPWYSVVAEGIPGGHIGAFKKLYGAKSNTGRAKQTLRRAGVQVPVDLDVWWTPSHYGGVSDDMYTEIKRQLESTDLFKVSLHSAEWNRYVDGLLHDEFAAAQIGWFPDFLDADNYIAAFYGSKTSFLQNHYRNPRIDRLIERERRTTDPKERGRIFSKIERLGAADVPLIPIWEGKQEVGAREGVSGLRQTLDASNVLRLWLISKNG